MEDDKSGAVMAIIIMVVAVFLGAYLMGFGLQAYLNLFPQKLLVAALLLGGTVWLFTFEDTWPVIVPVTIWALAFGTEMTFSHGPEFAREVPMWATRDFLYLVAFGLLILCGVFTWNRRWRY
ncbi:MAG: hypothetical protein GAK35_04305 [Herbaspirillum frisingense]|uniref:Uncharacterized protein n=1 Tax=Herbaspirillum frisingense TaxID=92645 RepID=A0A7V8FSL3_9BURK|nr:MAG: hypothetical protein GAK35_04305 [Herbaspirillum frisingense]